MRRGEIGKIEIRDVIRNELRQNKGRKRDIKGVRKLAEMRGNVGLGIREMIGE